MCIYEYVLCNLLWLIFTCAFCIRKYRRVLLELHSLNSFLQSRLCLIASQISWPQQHALFEYVSMYNVYLLICRWETSGLGHLYEQSVSLDVPLSAPAPPLPPLHAPLSTAAAHLSASQPVLEASLIDCLQLYFKDETVCPMCSLCAN